MVMYIWYKGEYPPSRRPPVTDTWTARGRTDYPIDRRRYATQFRDTIDALIDGREREKVRSKKRKVASADGRPAYPALPMGKLLLLQRGYAIPAWGKR
jgi:IS5 family transposase